MGIAAYYRGNRAISAGICREYGCRGCSRCTEYTPTPRPADWGSKTASKALSKARGLLRYMRERHDETPTHADLADMVRQDTRWGKATCADAARIALFELDGDS
jgi:hypothetical protein